MMLLEDNVIPCMLKLTGAVKNRSGLLVSDWADKYRILPASGVEGGKWKTDTTPYLKEIMDTLSEEDQTRVTVLMKAIQVGGSEAGYNFIGYIIGECPGNVILALPTAELYREVSRQRISPMIELSPEIASRMIETPALRTTIKSKAFEGGSLLLITAKSAPSLRMINARFLIMDEVDGYPLSIAGEGDPVALLMKRTSTFRFNSKTLITSTPLLEESSRVTEYYNQTDKCHYHVPCPFCGVKHRLLWENVRWDNKDYASARMMCPSCKKEFDESYKTDILLAGEWVKTATAKNKNWRGFHLSALYSKYGWYSWEQAAQEYDMSREDESKRQAFTNTVLAEPFKHYAYRPTIKMKNAQQMHYGDAGVHAPREVLVMTAGIDTQYRRVEIYVYGWGEGEVPYAIDRIIIKGDLSKMNFWKKVWETIKSMQYKTADGRVLAPDKFCIDSGGKNTPEVYRFIADLERMHVYKVIAIKGMSGYDRPIIKVSTTKIRRKMLKRDIDLYSVGVDTCKRVMYKKIEDKQFFTPINWASGDAVENEYFLQIVSEEMEKVYKNGHPRHVFVKIRKNNEGLDCLNYAYAGLKALRVPWDKLARRVGKTKTADVSKAKTADVVVKSTDTKETTAPIKARRRQVRIIKQ